MTTQESKAMVVEAIKNIKEKLCIMHQPWYDGIKSASVRNQEIKAMEFHLDRAYETLVLITQDELEEVA